MPGITGTTHVNGTSASHPAMAPEMHAHDLASPTSQNTLEQALALLHALENFQASLPLSRRLAFGRRKENTWLLTNLRLHDCGSGAAQPQKRVGDESDEPWLIAFVDRACRPETEVWFFGSWEVSSPVSSPESPSPSSKDAAIYSLLNSLLHALHTLPLAPSIHAPSLPGPSNPNTTLWGAIHERTLPFLSAFDLLPEPAATTFNANDMFIFPLANLPDPGPLPQGFRWGKLREEHFALVRARTSIPRQDRTLVILPNLAIYASSTSSSEGEGEGEVAPVAWAFIGLDSSLTSLHVEAPYRRLGLARKLTTKLFREELRGFLEGGLGEDERVAVAHVVEGNSASASMCRSLGGKSGWKVYWVGVDVGKV